MEPLFVGILVGDRDINYYSILDNRGATPNRMNLTQAVEQYGMYYNRESVERYTRIIPYEYAIS